MGPRVMVSFDSDELKKSFPFPLQSTKLHLTHHFNYKTSLIFSEITIWLDISTNLLKFPRPRVTWVTHFTMSEEYRVRLVICLKILSNSSLTCRPNSTLSWIEKELTFPFQHISPATFAHLPGNLCTSPWQP